MCLFMARKQSSERPLGVPQNPSELGFSDSSRIRPDLWSLETFNPFFPGVEGPFLPKKKSGLSFSKASFGSSGLQDTGNTDAQSFKILTTRREQTQQSPRVQLTPKRACCPGPQETSGIGHKDSGERIIREWGIHSIMCSFIQPVFILAG